MDDPLPALQQINFVIISILNSIDLVTSIELIVVILLLVFSGLISGSEIAYFSLLPKDLEEIQNAPSASLSRVKKLLYDQKRLLATILVANNLINVGLILLTTLVINQLINFSYLPDYVSFGIQVIGITFVILLFGEVIPKIYATKNALFLSKFMSFPLSFLSFLLYPVSYVLMTFTSIIDKHIKQRGLDVTVEDLSHALDLTSDIEEDNDEHKILKGIIKFGETSVKQIMTARVDVVALDKTQPYSTVIETILDSGYSRIPVFEDSFDTIIGIIYIKDLLAHIEEKEDYEWTKLLRTPFFVPENKKLDDLLSEFQEKKMHLAIVVDEYGGTSGIVSLEDILEEIVGEISDEFDDEDITYSKLDDNNYVFDGKTALNDVFKIINIDDDEFFGDEKIDAESLAGLVIEIAEKIPQKNEKIILKNLTFTVEASDKRRVKRIKLTVS
ncbi:MAG: gliding motility-associated protein GldE [Flavobacteriales bacterium]|nr:gliding motility-associated protein GldE [Flavobacteriales bacterium]MCW8911961.1 gliding motility-associated protein GldE [Flavobacteriales bacterium]MCW8937091.1 gliding motility-associated protein GldE [Flavobacteriales bacterium]MCW8940406.1 gliding motility-associated protein GldE [Flavobacteriales bacterium]MCW8968820.1 gliding motility-associated protein GldE [Flavobacteriales bacterium]